MSTFRRTFTHQEKISIISRHFEKGVSNSELARVNDVHSVTLYSWKRQIEFLSDRGSIYRALKKVEMPSSLNLKSCFTAAYSLESNGMAESLVRTYKRDNVYVNDCVSAAATLEMIPGWFGDYNENVPHSALDMTSPAEYIDLIT